MTDFAFDSRTVRFDLPLLFPGQAQKELYLNEAASRLDALIHLAVEAELAVPPTSPADGQAWLIAAGATGDWAGRAGQIASRQGGNWLYFVPRDGMNLLNRSTGQCLRHANGWIAPSRPAAPSGGTTIDAQARNAIGQILASLTAAGIFAA